MSKKLKNGIRMLLVFKEVDIILFNADKIVVCRANQIDFLLELCLNTWDLYILEHCIIKDHLKWGVIIELYNGSF